MMLFGGMQEIFYPRATASSITLVQSSYLAARYYYHAFLGWEKHMSPWKWQVPLSKRWLSFLSCSRFAHRHGIWVIPCQMNQPEAQFSPNKKQTKIKTVFIMFKKIHSQNILGEDNFFEHVMAVWISPNGGNHAWKECRQKSSVWDIVSTLSLL